MTTEATGGSESLSTDLTDTSTSVTSNQENVSPAKGTDKQSDPIHTPADSRDTRVIPENPLERDATDEMTLVDRIFAAVEREEEGEVEEEPVPEEEISPEPADLPPTPTLSYLARKERNLKTREESIQTQLKQMEDTSASLEAAGIRLNSAGEIDYSFLEEALSTTPKPEVAPETKRANQLEERLAKIEKRELEFEQKKNQTEMESLVSNFKTEVESFVDKEMGRFPAIEATVGTSLDGKTAVFNLITEYAQETGKILDLDDACKLVEDELAPQLAKFRVTPAVSPAARPTPPGKQPGKLTTILSTPTPSTPSSTKTERDREIEAFRILKEFNL